MDAIGVVSHLGPLERACDTLGCSPMEHHAWLSACAEILSMPSEVRALVVGGLDHPAAIAPLVKRGTRVPYFELLGARELGEPGDFIQTSEDAALALARALAELGGAIVLPRVRADSFTVRAMRDGWRGAGFVRCRPATGSPYIMLDTCWMAAEPPLNAGRRSDLRRARRRAERLGPVRTEIVCPEPAGLEALFAEFLRVEAAGWKSRQGSALTQDSLRCAFFRRYAEAACRAGTLRMCTLRIGDRAAAMQLAVESDNRLWLLKIGYDESFAHCSPGQLLLADSARYAASRGLETCELLGAPEPWTTIWTDRIRPCVSISAYPARPRGLAVLAKDAAIAGRRKVARLVARMI